MRTEESHGISYYLFFPFLSYDYLLLSRTILSGMNAIFKIFENMEKERILTQRQETQGIDRRDSV